jgi:hypothetical protein
MGKSSSRGLVGHSLYDKVSNRHNSSSSRGLPQLPQLPLFLLLMIALWAAVGFGYVAWKMSRTARPQLPDYMFEPVLISYSYFEKDPIQVCDGVQQRMMLISFSNICSEHS